MILEPVYPWERLPTPVSRAYPQLSSGPQKQTLEGGFVGKCLKSSGREGEGPVSWDVEQSPRSHRRALRPPRRVRPREQGGPLVTLVKLLLPVSIPRPLPELSR